MGETDALLVASIEKLPMISLKDVAELLKLPENTVKTRLRRARQMVGITLLEEGSNMDRIRNAINEMYKERLLA